MPEEKQEESAIEEDEKSRNLSIGEVIDNYVHRVLDIEDCARDFISIARKNYSKNSSRLKEEVSKCQKIMKILTKK